LRRLFDYAHYSALALEAGVPLRRLPALRQAVNLIDALSRTNLKANLKIVDVGAHCGEWSLACARLLPRCEILSFEPVPEYYQQARQRAAPYPHWKVLPVALGHERGRMPIAVRGLRSSFKPLVGSQFPDWAAGNLPTERTELVPVETLDAMLQEHRFFPVDVLKIDAEGYEQEILLGAGETLRRTKQILIEVRFHELFTGGPSFCDVHRMLADYQFTLMHLKPCRGQCLWADATYARRDA
jgi:FkbM family methyltransferase